MRRPGLGEMFCGDDALQRLCQDARHQRLRSPPVRRPVRAQPDFRHAGGNSSQVAPTADAECREPADRLEMSPEHGYRRRRGAQRDHVVTRLGPDHPPHAGMCRAGGLRGLQSGHRRSVTAHGALLTANR
jgi:hypothetical protein